MSPQCGRVSLVGAGPGDPELLTVKALRVLAAADVVLFDDLVSPAVLALSRATARRLHVGKRGYRKSCDQDLIERMMLRYARRGLHVVRLKSGDPLVFARAAEEIAALRAAGIPFEIVPGITSALALAAATQCPLTARGVARAVELVTAHDQTGALPAELAACRHAGQQRTLVVYMGARNVARLRDRLLAKAYPAATPAVAIAGLGCPHERRWCGELAALPGGVAGLPADLPVVIGVGAVFAAAAAGATAADPGMDIEPRAGRA